MQVDIFETKMTVERNRVLRETNQADRELHGFSRETARQPLSIPALIDLPEIFVDVLGQTDPLCNPLCNLTMSRQNRNVHLRPSARPRSTAFVSSPGEALRSFRVMARTNMLTNSSLLPMSIW